MSSHSQTMEYYDEIDTIKADSFIKKGARRDAFLNIVVQVCKDQELNDTDTKDLLQALVDEL